MEYCLTSYDIPIIATLEKIPASMFQNCKSLTTIELPAAIELGMNAIRGCDLIESISLPNVVTVGNFVFGDNPKLKEVNLPKATTWGTNVFLNCPAIESLSFPVATSFGTLAFSGCNALKSLRFGATGAITFAANMFGANNLATIPAGCDLFLNAAGTEYATVSGQSWKNYTWKSIGSYTP